jgi:hypothetical protein
VQQWWRRDDLHVIIILFAWDSAHLVVLVNTNGTDRPETNCSSGT